MIWTVMWNATQLFLMECCKSVHSLCSRVTLYQSYGTVTVTTATKEYSQCLYVVRLEHWCYTFRICIYMHPYTHTYPHIHTHTSTHPPIHTSTLHTQIQHPHIHTYKLTHSHIQTHASIHPHPHIHTSIHPHPHIHTSIYPYPHIHAYKFTHPHIQTHIHTSTHANSHIHTSIHTNPHMYTCTHKHVPTHTHPPPTGCGGDIPAAPGAGVCPPPDLPNLRPFSREYHCPCAAHAGPGTGELLHQSCKR